MLLTVLALILVLVSALEPHPNSLSRSLLVVRGEKVRLELRCQALSVIEVLGGDDNEDLRLDDRELAALAQPLAEYLGEHYLLRAGTATPEEAPLTGRLVHLASAPPEPGFDMPIVGPPLEWIELVVEYAAPQPVGALLVEVRLFRETAPDHRDLCRLEWNDEPPLETVFWLDESVRRYVPAESDATASGADATPANAAPTSGVAAPFDRRFTDWLALGFDHILSGWDHLAFVLALVLGASTLPSLLLVVTAFTLAHSVTLALAALEIVSLPGRPVELAIAASIAWLGFVTLRAPAPVSRAREAFAFGLIHGLGFAGFLGEALANEPQRLLPLLGFNLGVEAGQVAVVLALAALLLLLRRLAPAREEASAGGAASVASPPSSQWLAPTWLRRPLAAAVMLAGLWWCLERGFTL
ncbi:MAG: HupE/UreJ family protein [Planctomycetota bacterium]